MQCQVPEDWLIEFMIKFQRRMQPQNLLDQKDDDWNEACSPSSSARILGSLTCSIFLLFFLHELLLLVILRGFARLTEQALHPFRLLTFLSSLNLCHLLSLLPV